jgi:hypothetical protein
VTVPSGSLQVGLALEATYGVGVAAVMGLAWTQCGAVDNNPSASDQSWRGSAADCYHHETGVLDSTVQPHRARVLPDTIGYLLAGDPRRLRLHRGHPEHAHPRLG